MFRAIPLRLRILFFFALAFVLVFLGLIFFSFFSPQPTTTLSVSSTPSEATVTIGDKTYQSPVEIPNLAVGSTHAVTVSKPGYNEVTRSITLTQRPMQSESFTLEQIEVPVDGDSHVSEGLRIEQSPEYLEKIKKEPFWDVLPYWSPRGTFKVSYFQSNNYILISTFADESLSTPEFNSLTSRYREEALTWIRSNGGDPASLPIRYDPQLR